MKLRGGTGTGGKPKRGRRTKKHGGMMHVWHQRMSTQYYIIQQVKEKKKEKMHRIQVYMCTGATFDCCRLLNIRSDMILQIRYICACVSILILLERQDSVRIHMKLKHRREKKLFTGLMENNEKHRNDQIKGNGARRLRNSEIVNDETRKIQLIFLKIYCFHKSIRSHTSPKTRTLAHSLQNIQDCDIIRNKKNLLFGVRVFCSPFVINFFCFS